MSRENEARNIVPQVSSIGDLRQEGDSTERHFKYETRPIDPQGNFKNRKAQRSCMDKNLCILSSPCVRRVH